MSGDDLLLLGEVKGKVQQVFGLYENLEKEKIQLEMVNQTLKKEIETLNIEKDSLRKDLENLKLSKIIESGYGDSQEAKKKINSILREIDKCIALLSK